MQKTLKKKWIISAKKSKLLKLSTHFVTNMILVSFISHSGLNYWTTCIKKAIFQIDIAVVKITINQLELIRRSGPNYIYIYINLIHRLVFNGNNFFMTGGLQPWRHCIFGDPSSSSDLGNCFLFPIKWEVF